MVQRTRKGLMQRIAAEHGHTGVRGILDLDVWERSGGDTLTWLQAAGVDQPD